MASREKLIRAKPSNVQLMFNSHDPLAETQRAERATATYSPQEGDR